jgi:RNA-directed DNA polymerase
VLTAQAYIESGRKVVVDVDLEKFFDRVNHDILIERLRRHTNDAGVIRLIRAYLNSGILSDGVIQERDQGTPQGGPLSPLLANVLLDEVDKELEKRGHKFVRYADDCNVYVRSSRAGERVMNVLRRLYTGLKLSVNENKSAVGCVFGRKFLGYAFWAGPNQTIKRRVADKPLAAFKQRIRKLTRRSGGRSMVEVIDKLRPYILGWKSYFRLSQTSYVWQRLDQWMRHRLRAIQLKHWCRGPTIYREMIALGATHWVAKTVADNSRSWWLNSAQFLNKVLTIAYFDRLGMPRLS